MSDTIRFDCPKCDDYLNLDTNMGDDYCGNTIDSDAVPTDMADKVVGETIYCESCGREYTVVAMPMNYKKLKLVRD